MATMREMLAYKASQETPSVKKTQATFDPDAAAALNEAVKVCRLKSREEILREAHKQDMNRETRNTIRNMRARQNTLAFRLNPTRLETECHDALVSLRLYHSLNIAANTIVRKNGTIAAKPGKAETVKHSRECLSRPDCGDSDVKTRLDLLNEWADKADDYRSELKRLGKLIDHLSHKVNGRKPRNCGPHYCRDNTLYQRNVNIFKLAALETAMDLETFNDPDQWTPENEADLAEHFEYFDPSVAADCVTALGNDLETLDVEETQARITELNKTLADARPQTLRSTVVTGIERQLPVARDAYYPVGALDRPPRKGQSLKHKMGERERLYAYAKKVYEMTGYTDRVERMFQHLKSLDKQIKWALGSPRLSKSTLPLAGATVRNRL
jgi:hypothetical protein